MIDVSEVAGFFAAHAIWCVSEMEEEGDALTPMLAYTKEDGKRHMERIVHDNDLAASVEVGLQKLEANPMGVNAAVFLFDGRITLASGKVDAIIAEVRCYLSPGAEMALAIPYTPAKAGSGFKVHKVKVLKWDNCEDFDLNACFQAFFEGVDSHKNGSVIWNDCLDESI